MSNNSAPSLISLPERTIRPLNIAIYNTWHYPVFGLNSGITSEVRCLMNIGWMLSLAGHKVDFITVGNPGGSQLGTLPRNFRFVHLPTVKTKASSKYDLAISTPDNFVSELIDTELYILMYFYPNLKEFEFRTRRYAEANKNVICCLISEGHDEVNHKDIFPLPIPEIDFGISEKTTLTWSCKWNVGQVPGQTLEGWTELATYICSFGYKINSVSIMERSTEVWRLFEDQKDEYVSGPINYFDLLRCLSKSKLSASFLYVGSYLESIFYGSVPMIWKPSPFPQPRWNIGGIPLYKKAEELGYLFTYEDDMNEIKRKVKLLLEDDINQNVLTEYRKIVDIHSFKKSNTIFENLVRKYIGA